MNKQIKCITRVVILIFCSLTVSAFGAVKSVSEESFAQYGREDAYWVVKVMCDNSEVERTVRRKTDSEVWCSKEVEEMCDADKDSATELVCSSEYAQATGEDKSKPDLAKEPTAKKKENKPVAKPKQAKKPAKKQQAKKPEPVKDVTSPEEQKQVMKLVQEEEAKKVAEQEKPAAVSPESLEEQRRLIRQERLKLLERELELERRAEELEN